MIKSILIIDDDTIFRTGLVKILRMENYDVLEASDGQEGINLFQKQKPDLVITDILMPNKEGIETIIELKDSFPDQRILAMSGGGRGNPQEYLEFAKDCGAEKILKKPFKIDELLQLISSMSAEESNS